MTRRQSNSQWNGGISVHPAPKNSEYKNPLKKFSPRFFGIKMASSTLIIFQRAKLSTRSIYPSLLVQMKDILKEKLRGKVTEWGVVLPRQCPGSPGTCNTEETELPGLPVSSSLTLFSGSGPVGLPPVPWTEKKTESSPFFVQRGDHCCRGDLVGWTTF